MQPTSAPRYNDIATGTRRKWGEPRGGESMVAVAARRFTARPALSRRSHVRIWSARRSLPDKSVVRKHQSGPILRSGREIPLTVRGSISFCPGGGAKDLCDD